MSDRRKVYIPVKAYLKEKLTQLKGNGTYHEVIEKLLEAREMNLTNDERKALEKLVSFRNSLKRALGKDFTLEESVALLVNSLIDYGDCLDEKEKLEKRLKKAEKELELLREKAKNGKEMKEVEDRLKKAVAYIGELYPPNGAKELLDRVVVVPQDVYRKLVSLAREKRTAVEPFIANAVRGALVSYLLSSKL